MGYDIGTALFVYAVAAIILLLFSLVLLPRSDKKTYRMKILKAWKLAGEYHGNQQYGDDLPYLYHLGQVYLNANWIASFTGEGIRK